MGSRVISAEYLDSQRARTLNYPGSREDVPVPVVNGLGRLLEPAMRKIPCFQRDISSDNPSFSSLPATYAA